MKTKTFLAAAALALSLPMAAHAQGLIGGAQRGAEDGADAAGPVGAIVGGAVGAATGAVGGLLGVDDRPRFRSYAVRQHRSYDWDGDVPRRAGRSGHPPHRAGHRLRPACAPPSGGAALVFEKPRLRAGAFLFRSRVNSLSMQRRILQRNRRDRRSASTMARTN
nr:hypothetical protein [Methylobacterium frigidaeris]